MFITSTQKIKELDPYSIAEKSSITQQALTKFNTVEKTILNCIKLLMLIPPFWFLATSNFTFLFLSFLSSALIYMFAYRPLSFKFALPHIKKLILNLQRET